MSIFANLIFRAAVKGMGSCNLAMHVSLHVHRHMGLGVVILVESLLATRKTQKQMVHS
jgi:hypothetical protein